MNILVDGWKVCNEIKKKHKNVYNLLSSFKFDWFHEDEDHFFQSMSPVIIHDDLGKIVQFRFNNHDREPISPNLTSKKTEKVFESINILLKELYNPENQFEIKLLPGMLLIVYNWRVLHGRTEYSGSRRICGCYVAAEDFHSKLRKLGYNIKVNLYQ